MFVIRSLTPAYRQSFSYALCPRCGQEAAGRKAIVRTKSDTYALLAEILQHVFNDISMEYAAL